MANIPIVDKTGKEVGQYEIDTTELADKVTKQLLHDAVVMYRNNLRQGSVKTKGRSDVAGSKKKMYRQKGTGNARAGMKRTNVRVGGGCAFAIDNPDWSYRMNRIILDDYSIDAPKTKDFASVLKALKLNDVTTIFAIAEYNVNIYKSVRNIAGASVKPVAELNAYDILKPQRMLITKAALDAFRGKVAQEKN